MIKHPDTIHTGNEVVDSVITVLLSTTILVGGILGCFLDNIVPGTLLVEPESQRRLYRLVHFLIKVPRKSVDWWLGRKKWS